MKFIEIKFIGKVIIPIRELQDDDDNNIDEDEYSKEEILQSIKAGELLIPLSAEDIEIEKIKKVHYITN